MKKPTTVQLRILNKLNTGVLIETKNGSSLLGEYQVNMGVICRLEAENLIRKLAGNRWTITSEGQRVANRYRIIENEKEKLSVVTLKRSKNKKIFLDGDEVGSQYAIAFDDGDDMATISVASAKRVHSELLAIAGRIESLPDRRTLRDIAMDIFRAIPEDEDNKCSTT